MLAKIVMASLMIISAQSFAETKTDWSPCAKEMADYGCKKDGTDKEIWECLEKHDDALSKRCQKPHNENDAKFGKK